MINIGEPNRAFSLAKLPVRGVGLAREEFIINSYVGVHPLHLLMEGEDEKFVDALARGIKSFIQHIGTCKRICTVSLISG